MRRNTSTTLARLAERQQEVTRLERALSAALVRSDMGGREDSGAPEPCLDAALVRRQAVELKQEAEHIAQVLAAAAAPENRHHEAGAGEIPHEEESAPGPGELDPAEDDCAEERILEARVDDGPERTGEEYHPSETAEAAFAPAQQNAMLESLFRFLEHDQKPGR